MNQWTKEGINNPTNNILPNYFLLLNNYTYVFHFFVNECSKWLRGILIVRFKN